MVNSITNSNAYKKNLNLNFRWLSLINVYKNLQVPLKRIGFPASLQWCIKEELLSFLYWVFLLV
jgi:hypothetical protein